MKNNSSGIKARIKSFGFAVEGLRHLLVKEPNTRIHAVATVFVIAGGFLKGLTPAQWVAICFCIAIVWITEVFNTCMEMLCDLYVGEQYNATVKIIKDIAAAAVLIAAIISVVIGIIVFTS